MSYAAYEDVGPFPTFDSYLTAEDRTQLAYLAPQQVQQCTKAKIEELMNRARSLSSVCNASAPINCMLSQDVLMEVFSHLEPSFERPGQLNVLHVCRLWRHLLLYSTAFWVKVVSGLRNPNSFGPDGVGLFHTFLQRTCNAPLSFALDSVDLKLAEVLVPYAPRIVSMTITVTSESLRFVYEWLNQGHMPLLERLAISHMDKHAWVISVEPAKLLLDRARFPRLRSLRHPIKPMDISSVDSRLEELAVEGCTCPFCRELYLIQEEQVLPLLTAMLELCTSLQTLELDYVTHTLMLRTTGDRTISLPALRHLRIFHKHEISSFLASLVIPESCTVELSSGSDLRTSTNIRGLLPHDLAAFRQLASAERVRTRAMQQPQPGYLVTHLLEAYTDGLRRLKVSFGSRFWQPAEEFRLLLQFMPLLRVIDLEDDARYMANTLSQVTSGRCLCPQLEELHLRWNFWYDTRFEGLEKDRARSTSPDEQPGLPWPIHLHGPTVLAIFCEYLRDMLATRTAAGSPLKKIHVHTYRQALNSDMYNDDESWEPPVLRERMLAQLGSDCECELLVSYVEEDTK